LERLPIPVLTAHPEAVAISEIVHSLIYQGSSLAHVQLRLDGHSCDKKHNLGLSPTGWTNAM